MRLDHRGGRSSKFSYVLFLYSIYGSVLCREVMMKACYIFKGLEDLVSS